jgi:putative oxidoreductase
MEVALGLLVARLILGLSLSAHGAQKLFGWFGGYGLAGTGGFFEGLGFRPGKTFAFLAGAGELLGGALTLLGWLNPIGPALIIAVMLVAIGSVHWAKGFWQTNGGYELNLMNIAAALALAFAGPGPLSLDAVAPIAALHNPAATAVVIGIGGLGGLLSLAIRHREKPAHTQQPAAG